MGRKIKFAFLGVLVAALSVAASTHASRSRLMHEIAPGCSSTTAGGPRLAWTHPTFTGVGDGPFGVATARGYAFVSNQTQGLAVVADREGAPKLIRKISLPGRDELGMTITGDHRYLLIAGGSGAVVVDAGRAESGAGKAVLGMLSAESRGAGGAIEVTTSRDGRYAFVSLEDRDEIAVYRLATAIADHFDKSAYVGSVPTGLAPVGLAVSPDVRWLYSTSEIGGPGHPRLGRNAGSLSLISVEQAEHDPAHAVVRTVSAGCQPVRVAASPDGGTVWVSARGSDELLAFSAAKLESHPADALLAAVRVGAAPVGLAVVARGARIVVADSNRFSAPGASAALTVVSAAAALAHHASIVGTVRAQQFPRDMASEPAGNVLLVTNFGSGVLEAVHVFDHAQESHG
jgi:DNA-binding beta-propeller fold protein YncE